MIFSSGNKKTINKLRTCLLYNIFGGSSAVNNIIFCDCFIAINFIIEKCLVETPSISESTLCTSPNCKYVSHRKFPLVRVNSDVLNDNIQNLNAAVNAAFPSSSHCIECKGNTTIKRSFENQLFIEVRIQNKCNRLVNNNTLIFQICWKNDETNSDYETPTYCTLKDIPLQIKFGRKIYSLCGCVIYSNGHYTAAVKRSGDGSWELYDDLQSKVSYISAQKEVIIQCVFYVFLTIETEMNDTLAESSGDIFSPGRNNSTLSQHKKRSSATILDSTQTTYIDSSTVDSSNDIRSPSNNTMLSERQKYSSATTSDSKQTTYAGGNTVGSNNDIDSPDNNAMVQMAETTSTVTHFASSDIEKLSNKNSKSKKSLPVAFKHLSKSNKVKTILTWIMNDIPNESVMNHTRKIDTIQFHLNNIPNNAYMRLFEEVDVNILKEYLSEKAWCELQNFKAEHQNDMWHCHICFAVLSKRKLLIMCDKCMLWFHQTCLRKQSNLKGVAFNRKVFFCNSCLN